MMKQGDKGDGSRGPEWAAMMARHEKEGVVRWHADRRPGVTDEQVAAEMNRIDEWLSVPQNRVASALGGRAFLLRDSANCTLHQSAWNGETFAPVKPSKIERIRAEDDLRFADLLDEAAELLTAQASKANAQ